MLISVDTPQRYQRQNERADRQRRQMREEGVVQREEDVADDPDAVTAGPLRNEDRADWNPANEVDVGL